MKEFSGIRADAMQDKSLANQQIKTLGNVRLSDLNNDKSDSLSKNLLSVYFIGAQINSNLVDSDYLTPYTLKQRQLRVQRV